MEFGAGNVVLTWVVEHIDLERDSQEFKACYPRDSKVSRIRQIPARTKEFTPIIGRSESSETIHPCGVEFAHFDRRYVGLTTARGMDIHYWLD
jgi:hypothetical protein